MVYPTQKLPFEKLTTIDERVDFIHNQVAATQDQLGTVQGQLGDSQAALNLLLEKEGLPTMAKVQKQIVFKHTVEALAGLTDHQRIPMLKTVKTITIHWPDGCNSLVEVAVGYSQDKRLLPEIGYLALNDATPTWPVLKDTESDTLWVELRNGDSVNQHVVSVIINYEEM
ncbi:MAG: hypothetical protein Q7J06_07455 [Bacteroidales bacterium]|nr:hypothetical protein [Bacteroidales bacterium]